MKALIVCESVNGKLSGNAVRLATAAKRAAGTFDILYLGDNEGEAKSLARLVGCNHVIRVTNAGFDEWAIFNLVAAELSQYTHILAQESHLGRVFASFAAAKLGVDPVGNVDEVLDSETVVCSAFSGTLKKTVKASSFPFCMTVRASAFEALTEGSAEAPITVLQYQPSALKETQKVETVTDGRPLLTQASVIVSGGRGLDAEGFALLAKLADKLNAGLGATRAAVDAELATSDCQVGQTGQIVAPDVYIAFAISGAMQHLSGIKDAKTVVAVNTDPEAPIMEVADIALIADAKETIEKLLNLL